MGFTNTLTIGSDNALTVTNAVLGGGTLNFGNNQAALNIDGGGSTDYNLSIWSGTNINSTGTSRATIYVYNSAVMWVETDARYLGVDLDIGKNAQHVDSAASVTLSPGSTELNDNIQLCNDAHIYIQSMGKLILDQGENSATAGGIDMAAGSDSEIVNRGTMWRSGGQPGGLFVDPTQVFLQITPPVVTFGSTAVLKVSKNPGANIEFVNKYIQLDGKAILFHIDSLKGFVPKGGTVVDKER